MDLNAEQICVTFKHVNEWTPTSYWLRNPYKKLKKKTTVTQEAF